MTLRQEFSVYAVMIDSAIESIIRAADLFQEVNMGATSVGTGINSPHQGNHGWWWKSYQQSADFNYEKQRIW